MPDAIFDLEQAGYDAHFRAALEALSGALVPARIAAAYGESYSAWTAQGPRQAVILARRLVEWRDAAQRPQVGDFVAGSFSAGSDSLHIEHVLPRRTCLTRLAAGGRGEAQVIAANLDVVGVVSAFGVGDEQVQRRLVNERRLERYLAVVQQSGAKPLLIVNKCDLAQHAEATVAVLRESFPGVALAVISAARGDGLEQLQPWLVAGQTLGLVGMSGVGKSTLVNALLGRSVQRTGAIREGDARGRHTTSHRELFVLPNGALLMDMPGMRELGLWEPDAAAQASARKQARSPGRFRRQ